MNKKLARYSVAGVLFVWVFGSLSHFFYDWSGANRIVGLFCPVNESTWEHIKLLFFPMLLYAVFMARRLRDGFPFLPPALAAGLLSGSLLIPVLFYTYTGILGRHTLFLDIATFLVSVAAAFALSFRLALNGKAERFKPLLFLLAAALAVLFPVFSYAPPNLALFKG